MTKLEHYAAQLAKKVQATWEAAVQAESQYRHDSVDCKDAKATYKQEMDYQKAGTVNYGRNYYVEDHGDTLRVAWWCNVSSMPMTHCVINKETGDLARYTTELVNEAFFQFNLLDDNSRLACLTEAEYTAEYLR